MKALLLSILAIISINVQAFAQKNACDNTVQIYAPPTVISNLDSNAHESITKYFQRYLISQQQAFNYKLVDNQEDADLELITTYVLKNPGLRNQTTEMEFTIRDIENPQLFRTIIEAYNTSDSTLYNASKDVLSHQGSEFLETLQHQNTLYAFFAPTPIQHYRHKADPDMVFVIEPFTAEELPNVSDHFNCLQELLLKGMQGHARFTQHNVNISFQNIPSGTDADVPVIKIKTEIEEFADEYVIAFSTDERPFIHEITIPKKFLDKGLYRPFIEGKMLGAGGGLLGKILF